MLARQLVDAALQRLAKTEIIPVQRQNFLPANGVEHPIRQLDFDPKQAAIEPMLAAYRSSIDKAETFALLFIARADICCYAGACKPVDCFRFISYCFSLAA